MTSPPTVDADRGTRALRWWAGAIIPVMMIVPFYVFPINVGERVVGVFDGRRLIEIAWAGVLVLALLHPRLRAAAAAAWLTLSRAQRATLCVFLAGALASSLLASAPAYALRSWALMTTLLVAALPLAALLAPVRARLLEVLGLTLLFYAILIFGDPTVHGFSNPRLQGQALAVTAPALLFSGSYMLALMAAPALALGALNGSRALVLVIIGVTVVALVAWPDRKRRMLPGLAGLAVAGALLALLASGGQGTTLDRPLGDRLETSSVLTRLSLWEDALGRFLQAPVLGHGPAMLARAPGVGWEGSGHPHNIVLLVAAETGLVGLISLGVLGVLTLRPFFALAPDRRPWALALVAAGGSALVDGTNIMPAAQALLLVALALALPIPPGSPGDATPAPPEPRSRWTGWSLAAGGAIALVLLLSTLSLPPDADEPDLRPRFYQRGITP